MTIQRGLWGFALLVGCSGADAVSTDADLVGGVTPQVLPPGIVALHVECTAVKIGPREFLTAGHCVVRGVNKVDQETLEPAGTFARGQRMCVYSSLRVAQADCIDLGIVSTKVHPTYAAHVETHLPSAASEEVFDLAVVRVDRDSPQVPIAELGRRPIAVGTPIVMAGYGCATRPTPGTPTPFERTLREGRTTIDSLQPKLLYTEAGSGVSGCPGDSGGPVYAMEDGARRVVGINSFVRADDATAMARVDVESEARSWVESLRTPGGPAAAGTCVIADSGACRAVEARDVRVLGAGGFHMPGAAFSEGGQLFAFGARYATGSIITTASTDLRSFTSAQALPWQPASDVTGATVSGVHSLYFVGRLGADVGGALYVSRVHGNLVDSPARVALTGTSIVPYWPQAAGLPDGRTLLAFVEPQKRAFLAVDDGRGLVFQTRAWPNVTGELKGVLAHVGTTARGSWVITHQVADASWAFSSFVQLSKDAGQSWSVPKNLQADDSNIHDAFPVARRDEGADVYYLRAGPRAEFNVRRRAVGEDGALGPEQIVTMPDVGHVEKPQPRRLPDGRIALMFAVRRSEKIYDLAMTVLDGDSPR